MVENRDCEVGIKHEPLPVTRSKRKLESEERRNKRTTTTRTTAGLSEEDVEVIRKGEWLGDAHMVFASSLLKRQFPQMGGLHDTKYGSDLSFPPKPTHLCRY